MIVQLSVSYSGLILELTVLANRSEGIATGDSEQLHD